MIKRLVRYKKKTFFFVFINNVCIFDHDFNRSTMLKRYISTLLLIIIHSTCLLAQDYIYSVTVGTSWAREVFPAEERANRSALRQHPLTIEGAPQFAKTFLDLEHDFRYYNTYNDSIFYHLSHSEWIEMFKRRAKAYSQIYTKNSRSIASIKDYFTDENIPEAAYDSLYYWTRHLFFRNANDIFFYEQIMDILLPHYEATQDIEHLVFCYLCSGMVNFQCSRMGDKESELRSKLYFLKIMDLSNRFTSFKDPLNRYYFISAFVNLAVLHAQSSNISLNESRQLASSMKALYAVPENQEVFRKDSLLNEYTKWSIDLFRYRGILTYISHGEHSPELRDHLYKEYCNVREELGLTGLKNRYYGKLDYDDLLIEAYMGNMSWNKAFETFHKKLDNDPEMQQKTGVPSMKINYLYNLYESFSALLERTSYPESKKAAIIKEHLSDVLDMIARYEHDKYSFEKGRILANIACKPLLLKHLTPKEREDLLFRLIVVEQPMTYVHVSMTAELTRVLTEALIDKKPEFFIGVPGIKTVEDVALNRASLSEFAYQSAIYHDLGKISIPTIINNSFRPLTDHEFAIIKLHPEKSRQFFDIDPSLKQYQDIALGHHKWYDGEGYPTKFKSRKSPYFPIISIVTLCDCMDAATENIGRNYHTPRSFENVMSEFAVLSGEQFHPDLIDFIQSDSYTYKKLKLVVDDGRYDNYYKLYMRYMDQNRRR